MVNQHIKWLRVTRRLPWRAPIASLNYTADLARVAAGPQRLLPPGPRLRRPHPQQEPRGGTGLSAAGRQHPALGGRPRPAQPRLRERHRGRQAALLRLAVHGPGPRALQPAAPGSGTGPVQRGGGPDVVLACAGDVPTQEVPGRRRAAAPPAARNCRCAW
ncbi:hypothetical protein LT493_04225 [Streptomyces tricolor]|nr:hypothetical protein [Streptomyces tricolor]